jgi:hypothetical protein
VAEWVSAFTNSSTYTYEVAPVYSLMEIEVINHLLKFVGYEVRRPLLPSSSSSSSSSSPIHSRLALECSPWPPSR